MGDKGDIYIINTYTMTLNSHICFEFEGVVQCSYNAKSSIFTLCDTKGLILSVRDERAIANYSKQLNEYEEAASDFRTDLATSNIMARTKSDFKPMAQS